MDLLNTWLPPAVIIGVVVYTNRLLANGINKRIDDCRQQVSREIDNLRHQMKSDHESLANHLTRVENKLDNHIANYEIHDTGREKQ